MGGVIKDAKDKFALSLSGIMLLQPIFGIIAIINKIDLYTSVHSEVLIAS